MFAYTIRRLLQAIPILLVASFIAFWLASVSFDPVATKFAGRNPPVPRQTILLERHRMHMDEGFFTQYFGWLKNIVLHADFGPSIESSTINVRTTLLHAVTVTARLVTAALVISVVLAVLTGVISAYKQYTWFDYAMTFIGFLFLAMPAFWIATLLKQGAINFNEAFPSLNRPNGSGFIPTIYDRSTLPPADFGGQMLDYFLHLVLPTISLSLINYAGLSRFQRSSMLEVLNSDYVRLARAKGLRPRTVMVRHALRTALIPMTTATSLTIAVTLGGAVITETVFQWRGMGDFLVNAINNGDRFGVQGWLLLAGFIVVLGNIVADLLYGVLDPRIRYA